MSKRSLIILAILALVVISAALLLKPRNAYRPGEASGVFLPGLLEQANDLNSISLYGAGDVLIGHFTRVDGDWISSNPAGYPADRDNIRSVVGGLAKAKISESKTANPEYYERLGVSSSSNPQAAGLRIELGSESSQWSAIIGNNAVGGQGYYARVPDQPTSVLLDTEFSLSHDPIAWLEQEVVNLPAAEVQSVTIQHPGGVAVVLKKFAQDGVNYFVLGVPENREARTGYTVNAVAAGLANLEMQGVVAADAIDFSGGISVLFECFDGRRISAELVKADDNSWIRVSAEYVLIDDPAGIETGASEADGNALPAWVEAVNSKKSAWEFAIPEYKYDTLTRELEDLLEPLEE